MKLVLKTKVQGYYTDVMEAFDRQLFEALAPPIGKLEIVEFTGSKKGDIVHLRFLSPLKAEWISDITDHGQDEKSTYFIDVGRVLPPGLKFWKHRHIVEKIDDKTSFIIDDISYKGLNSVLSWLMYPILFLSFYPRKRIYRKYFDELASSSTMI
jgi:ligand-binding SRPBCC domain-containing protein